MACACKVNKYIDSVDKGYKLYSRVKEENIAFEDLSYDTGKRCLYKGIH